MSFIIWKERFFRQWRAVWGRLERRFRKFRKETPENQKASLEKQFLERWTAALMERADVFNGLYGGLLRVQEGTAKKKGKILSEWWHRTRYQWDGQELTEFCRPVFEKLLAEEPEEEYRKYARLLLEAAAAAGITRDEPGELTLDELTTNAYTDWEAEQLYLGDRVKVLLPAWYQNGRVLEQGSCQRLDEEENEEEMRETEEV